LTRRCAVVALPAARRGHEVGYCPAAGWQPDSLRGEREIGRRQPLSEFCGKHAATGARRAYADRRRDPPPGIEVVLRIWRHLPVAEPIVC